MRRLGKILLGSTAAMALVAGAMTVSTTPASSQDIEGMIRGALAHYYGGGHHRARRGRTHEVHEARRGRHHKGHEDADAGRDKHPHDNGDRADAKPDRKEFSSRSPDSPDTKSSPTNPPPSGAPPSQPKAGGDVPSFTPEK